MSLAFHDTIYLTIERNRYYRPRVVKMSRRRPKLTEKQTCFCVKVEIPDAIFNPPQISLSVSETNIIRPEVKASQV